MNKQELITTLAARRDATGVSTAEIALRSGLTERSVRNALSLQGNPQLSSLLALVDALGLELQLAPKGFGETTGTDPGYRPVTTRVGHAVAQAPAPPPYTTTNNKRRSP
ncbi:transcriptional regulator with XRE-family HTH domain [Variovorax boronicumulans]|uniref:helix-turn-helix domain-containing protein n=1 Tax=Variovorax boronicumulans TaxID=436515 RepID=UPI0027857B04|nr:transcriptional regulator [Variovorax boronicumulans]MDQ0015705.1 transcriptional regulator with XRE-family HTH domain [Variovorax boronicumulans]